MSPIVALTILARRNEGLSDCKEATGRERDWTCVKEFPSWAVEKDAGTVVFPEQNIQELLTLLAILETQCCIGRK